MPDTLLVVPCYNEAGRLDIDNFKAFLESNPEFQVLFVDDGSTDTTLSLLYNMRESTPSQVSVLPLKQNRGKAEAVRQGFIEALKHKPVFIGYWDADLATPLEPAIRFREILKANENLQAVFGSRVRLLGRQISRPALRHYLGRIFATFSSLSLGFAVYDTQCGAKLFRVSDALSNIFQQPFIGKWVFDVEILQRISGLHSKGVLPPVEEAVLEYPLESWSDTPGSKLSPGSMVLSAFDLFRLWLRHD